VIAPTVRPPSFSSLHASHLVPADTFRRIREAADAEWDALPLLADLARWNVLSAVKTAGSGHLGTSFSAMELLAFLHLEALDVRVPARRNPGRDVFISSKGHDAPAQYAILHAQGIVSDARFLALRRAAGLPGHPDVRTGVVEATTGSLGMGISKGRGLALAKNIRGEGGRVVVLTGDGELQEGQVYEALQAAGRAGLSNLTVVVDHNQVQSERPVDEIGVYDDLEARIHSFGWHVSRCDGHDAEDIRRAWAEVLQVTDRPSLIIADTVKGKGVSFMEHPADLVRNDGVYRWHAGAPADDAFVAARTEIRARVLARCEGVGITPPELPVPADVPAPLEAEGDPFPTVDVGQAFGLALERLGKQRDDLVVLDADLRAEGHLTGFARRFPERFVECGIAEQDMVSTASGLALSGFLPVVSSFAAFLAARANEQIYNVSCEGTRLIYALHYAGVTPSAPGLTHQSVRDASLLASLPDVVVVAPSSETETERLLDHAIHRGMESWAFRLQMGACPPLPVPVPERPVVLGQGTRILDGSEATLVAYGPVLLREAAEATLLLRDRGISVRLVAMPFLNRVDGDWLEREVAGRGPLYVMDDHSPVGGLADHVQNALAPIDPLARPPLTKLAVRGLPSWGSNEEALHAHGLDAASVAARIARDLGEGRSEAESA